MAKLDNEPSAPFGRVRLDRVYSSWSSHPFKAQLLASEVADTLRTLAPGNQPIDTMKVCAYLDRRPDRSNAITFDGLADYLDSAGTRYPSSTIATQSGPVEACTVFIWQGWIDQVTNLAAGRVALACGYAQPVNDEVEIALSVNGHKSQASSGASPSLPVDSPVVRKLQQTQARRDAERSASEKVEHLQVMSERDQREIMELKARIQILESRHSTSTEENERLRREANECLRAQTIAQHELAQMQEERDADEILRKFLTPANEFSPPEILEMFECWKWLTTSGTREPVSSLGRGTGRLCEEWFRGRGTQVSSKKLGRFATALTLASRKLGGVVPAPTTQKG